MTNHYHPAGLARLIVAPDATATGTFGAPVDFMDLRAQRHPRPRVDTSADADTLTATELHPHTWAGDRNAALAIGQRLGPDTGVHFSYTEVTEHTGVAWLLDPATGSWATVATMDGPPYKDRAGRTAQARRRSPGRLLLVDTTGTAPRRGLDGHGHADGSTRRTAPIRGGSL